MRKERSQKEEEEEEERHWHWITRTEWHHFGWITGNQKFQVNWSTDLNLSLLVFTRKFCTALKSSLLYGYRSKSYGCSPYRSTLKSCFLLQETLEFLSLLNSSCLSSLYRKQSRRMCSTDSVGQLQRQPWVPDRPIAQRCSFSWDLPILSWV